MSNYQKPCIFCNQEIRMSNDTGKWTPYNLDNTIHECKGKDRQPQTQAQQQPNRQVLEQPQQSEAGKTVWAILEDYNRRLKKVESKVFGTN